MAQILSSLWDGLSDFLIAEFFPVEPTDGGQWVRSTTDDTAVRAPLTDANLEVDLGWNSPFEGAGAESRAPALAQMAQGGLLQPIVDATMGADGEFAQSAKEYLNQYQGRTGITKLNSTQIFSSMQPAKISCTAIFRAWRDAATEVEAPFDQLMKWSLPQELSRDGSILARAAMSGRDENMSHVEALMPSLSPVRIGMRYKGRTFAPLVIESISMPLSSPINASGQFIELRTQLTLSTLTAIDRNDWDNFKTIQL